MKSTFVYLLISFALVTQCFAQKSEPKQIIPEWAEMDIKGVSFVMRLTPIENRRIQDDEKLFNAFQHKNAAWSDKSSLGFGAERIKLSIGLGYTTVYIATSCSKIGLFITKSAQTFPLTLGTLTDRES